jgi:hypothetical protein
MGVETTLSELSERFDSAITPSFEEYEMPDQRHSQQMAFFVAAAVELPAIVRADHAIVADEPCKAKRVYRALGKKRERFRFVPPGQSLDCHRARRNKRSPAHGRCSLL